MPGHTLGSIVVKYENYIFSGDSIGTGYIGVGALTAEEYIQSVQHLLDSMGAGKYIVYGGHTGECRGPMTEKYVTDLLLCARAMVANTIAGPPYWRSGESSTRKVSTVGGSSITYSISAVHRIVAALRGLRISPGTLYQGYEPQFALPAGAPATRSSGFAPLIGYYYAAVDGSVDSLTITPTVQDADYKSLTVNGAQVRSEATYNANLNPGKNRLAIAVTAADGATRTYPLFVVRNARCPPQTGGIFGRSALPTGVGVRFRYMVNNTALYE